MTAPAVRCGASHPAEPGIHCSAPEGHHDAHQARLGLVLLVWVGNRRRVA